MDPKNFLFAATTALAPFGYVAADDGAADPSFDIYGRVDVSVQSSDPDGAGSIWEVRSNASRFGFRGDMDLNGDVEAFFQLEWSVGVTPVGAADGTNIKARNQYLGLRGDWGTFRAGRFDSPIKTSQLKFDQFNDTTSDIFQVMNGERRPFNIFEYESPAFAGMNLKVAMLPGEDVPAGESSIDDAMSASLVWRGGAFQASLGLDSDVEGQGVQTGRVTGLYKWSDFQFGLMYQETSNATGLDTDGFGLSARYTTGPWRLKAQYMDADHYLQGLKGTTLADMVTVGVDYVFNDDAFAYAFISSGEVGATGLDAGYYGVGFRYSF